MRCAAFNVEVFDDRLLMYPSLDQRTRRAPGRWSKPAGLQPDKPVPPTLKSQKRDELMSNTDL
jgi:hypothetical protein